MLLNPSYSTYVSPLVMPVMSTGAGDGGKKEKDRAGSTFVNACGSYLTGGVSGVQIMHSYR